MESIVDPVKRNAVRTMIRTTGQTPKQLFTAPHPSPSLTDRRSLSDVVCLACSLAVCLAGLQFKQFISHVFRPVCYVIIGALFTGTNTGSSINSSKPNQGS